jgi:hypothetical protein
MQARNTAHWLNALTHPPRAREAVMAIEAAVLPLMLKPKAG